MGEKVATFMGRNVTDLTREELIEAYTRVCLELYRLRQAERDAYEMERLFDVSLSDKTRQLG